MNSTKLKDIAQKMVSRCILAADESTSTIQKRFTQIKLQSTPETNQQYRQLLFTAPGIEKYISGVILFDETIRQTTDDGTPFPQLLKEKNIVPGIKVDKGAHTILTLGLDTFTQGFDGLSKRLEEYRELGAGFAKWRAVFEIDTDHPTETIIQRNAHDLALYALLCQQAEIVPIVEPEVLMDGEHSLERDREVTTAVLHAVFTQLKAYGVYLEGMILKPNMITAGTKHTDPATVETVSQETLDVLKNCTPTEVPGIAFLSGGQSPDLATEHLREINKIRNAKESEYPWRITASYGRALQGETIEAWGGKQENIAKAQEVFIARAEKVYKASLGE